MLAIVKTKNQEHLATVLANTQYECVTTRSQLRDVNRELKMISVMHNEIVAKKNSAIGALYNAIAALEAENDALKTQLNKKWWQS